MIFGFRSKSSRGKHKQSYWYRLKTYEETDSALLRLLECFMEAAPQLTLQLYIVVCHGIKQNLMLGKSKARKVQSSFFFTFMSHSLVDIDVLQCLSLVICPIEAHLHIGDC